MSIMKEQCATVIKRQKPSLVRASVLLSARLSVRLRAADKVPRSVPESVPVPVPLPDPTRLPIRLVVPRGGTVCVSIGFYGRKQSSPVGQNEWCAAKGTTGAQDNAVNQLPDHVVDQIKIPIVPGQTLLPAGCTADCVAAGADGG